MKIIILGARGNLGSQLAGVFARAAAGEILGLDKEDIDLTDGAALAEKIESERPQIIINAAAYTAVDRCEADENEFALAKKLNGEAVGILAEAAEKIGAILIHYSTDYVFPGSDQKGYDETAAPDPINNYGRSKLLGEEKILGRPNLKFYLIRTSKLFGPKGESEISKPNFFDIMLKAAAEKSEVKAVDEEMSCFTYTPDLAAATKKLLDEKMPFGLYHITNSGAANWYEACLELFKLAGIKTKVVRVSGAEFPRPAKRPANSVLLNTKLQPLRSYQDALKEYLK